MQKRVADITQAFEHCRFQDSLRQIADLQRKLDAKKKNKINDNEASVIAVVKAGSLAGVGQLHQAHALMNRQFPTIDNINHDLAFLFLQICQISMDTRTERFLQLLDEKHKDKDPNLRRFAIQFRQFSKLSKYYLKQYTTSKKPENSLHQIAMEYYNSLNTNNMINFARDPVIEQKPQLKMKLKMVEMFMMKFVQQMNEKQLQSKVQKATTDLRLRLAIHSGNCKLAKQLFQQKKTTSIEEPFRYLRSIKKLAGSSQDEQKDNFNFYIKGCLEIFRTNLNLEKYTPFYDYYNQFLSTILENLNAADLGELVQNLPKTTLQKEQLYTFKDNLKDQFINYYQSLNSEYLDHIANKETLGKQDYYKICIKGLLLQLIRIQSLNKLSHTENNTLKNFILQYRDFFGKTLTYPMQIKKYGLLIDSDIPASFTQEDDKLIYQLNVQKIFGRKDIRTTQQLQMRWKQCEELYERNVNEVQKKRKLQKGQKYLSDDFIVILADIVRKFVENNQNVSKQQRLFYIMGIISLLQKCAYDSPYNFDLKLRLIHFYGKVNYFDSIIDVCSQMDIKSVQYQTLGFWILRPIIEFDLAQNNELLLIKMMRSYQENFRQCAQYALKAVNKVSYNQVQQYLSYQNNHRRSYNRIILLYALLLKYNRKPNSQFYLQKILQIYEFAKSQGKLLTLNCDFKTISSQIYPDESFVDFFGVYNNSLILKEQCMLRMAQYDIINKKVYIQQLKDKLILNKWEVKDLFAFQNYQIFQRKISYQMGSNSILEQQLATELKFHCEIIHIRHSAILLANQMLKQAEQAPQAQYQEFMKLLENLCKNFYENLVWRQQTKLIVKIRMHILDIYFLFQAIAEEMKKNKKTFKGIKKSIAELCQNIKTESIKIMTECKFQQRDKIDKKWYSEECVKRDDILERISSMNAQQLKKNYHL